MCIRKNGDNKRLTTEQFIRRAIKVHGNRYDYSKVNYVGMIETVCIICPIHGEFWQKASIHIAGSNCPKCKSSKGELSIISFLSEHDIKYIQEKRFNDCKYKSYLKFDFYLPELNICIEFDGKQHFKPNEFFGGDEALEETKIRDEIKNKYCENNNIKLIRIRYDECIDDKLTENL